MHVVHDGISSPVRVLLCGTETVPPIWQVLPQKTRELLNKIQEDEWKTQYLQLAHFRFVHGHMVVHLSTDKNFNKPQLANWMYQQHVLYRDFLEQFEGMDNKSTEIVRSMFEKIELLRLLGFIFQSNHFLGVQLHHVPPVVAAVAENNDNNNNNAEKIAANTKAGKRKANWDTNLMAIRDFRDEHGHCDCSDPSLKTWLNHQRKRLKGEAKKAAPLADDEIQRLEDIGILKLTKKSLRAAATQTGKEGTASSSGGNQSAHVPKNLSDPKRFDQMYEEMKKFWQENGHTVVPEKGHGKLRAFLVDVRTEYKKHKNGETSEFLTPERIERLKQIDFSLEARVKYTFDERFEQWLQYRLDHNGMNPTTTTALGKWVSKTRMRYHDTIDGKQVPYQKDAIHHLTADQIKKLKLHAFDLGERDPNRPAHKTWEERYEELLEYRADYGNVDVPQKFPGLGDWVHKQRQRRYKLTQDKVDKLEEVGFTWLTRKRPTRKNKPAAENDATQDDDSVSTDAERFFY